MTKDQVCSRYVFFFFNDTATTEIYTLSLHDALPILPCGPERHRGSRLLRRLIRFRQRFESGCGRSEEHTSELQSRSDLVCRLLLEKKKKNKNELFLLEKKKKKTKKNIK